jgi:hypothetical protein
MSLLPPSSTDFENSVEGAIDKFDIIAPALDGIKGVKYARPLNPTVAPWLVEEYGLGPISQYFGPGGRTTITDRNHQILTTLNGDVILIGTTIEVLIDEGRQWQRIRGTPQAVVNALGWISYYNVAVEDQVVGRRRWHLYQIDMGELPLPDEEQRLADAEYLAGISDPARSIFSRGYFGYDVRVHIWGRSRYSRSIWGADSGVILPPGQTKWSHGRYHDTDTVLTADDLDALGIDYNGGDEVAWDSGLSWEAEGVSWDGVDDAPTLRAWILTHSDAYLGFYDADGDPIGYSKILTKPVVDRSAGTVVRYEARTGFGDGAGHHPASAAIVYGGANGPTVKPFKRWLTPDQIEFAAAEIKVGDFPVDIDFLKTVREFFTVNLTVSS